MKYVRIFSSRWHRMTGKRRLFFAVFTVLGFFIVLELGARALFAFDPQTAQGDFPVNSDGFRDVEHQLTKPAGVFRILLVGDSVAWGHGLPFDSSLAHLLEGELNRACSTRTEVLLFAQPGWNTREKIEGLKSALRYKPDLVLYQYDLNDVDWEYGLKQIPFSRKIGAVLYFSRFLRALKVFAMDQQTRGSRRSGMFLLSVVASAYQDENPSWIQTQEMLRQAHALCRENNITPVMTLDLNIPVTKQHDIYQTLEGILSMSEQIGFSFIPIYRLVDRDNPRNYRIHFLDFHPSRLYNTKKAEAIVDYFKTRLPSGPFASSCPQ